MDIVTVKGLTAGYQMNDVLRDITFSVASGEYIGVVGPNGAGKTTLIKTMLGLMQPSAGSISLFGRPLPEFRDWRLVGYLPQKPLSMNSLFPATVKEIVSLGLVSRQRFPRRAQRSDEAAIDAALEEMQILSIKDALVGDLSGGQQQRVLAARAIVHSPKLLILDEPVTALDPAASQRFMKAIQRLNKDRNVTVLLVTHDLANIGKYASKLLYIDRRLVFFGTFQEVCRSKGITAYFGEYLQHLMCHQHDLKERI